MAPKISISIDVQDMAQAGAFYAGALGCERVREGDDVTVLSAENTTIYLLRKAPGTNPLSTDTACRDYARHWTPIHLDFVVADIDEALTRVVAQGGSHEGGDAGD